MATRIKTPSRSLYDDDFYVWSEQQAALLREGRLDQLDLEHLIDEVEELGDSKRDAALNDARVVTEHLLKLEHSPAMGPRANWRASVLEHRARLEIGVTPRIRQILEARLPYVYGPARRAAEQSLRDHGEDAAADTIPETCPYTLDQIMGEWLP